MTLYKTLREYGIFSNELRKRLDNNQILVNGIPQGPKFDMGNVSHIYDQGFFLEELYKMPNYDKWRSQLIFIGLVNLIGGESNIENDLTEYLKDFNMIQVSKDVAIFAKSTDSVVDEIIIHKESGKTTSKVEDEVEVDQTEIINKLKIDRDKVSKQLSNKGFVMNAPKFKVDAAKKRLDNINSKLKDFGVNENKVMKFKDFK